MKYRKTGDLILIPKGTLIFSKLLNSEVNVPDDTIAMIEASSMNGAYFIKPKYVHYSFPKFEPELKDMGFDKWSVLIKNVRDYEDPMHLTQFDLKKYEVCASCKSIEKVNSNCICNVVKIYPTIELEFEVCRCCGNPITPSKFAKTDNNLQAINDYYKLHIS